MIEVEHPTLGIIEFPDGTSPEQMKAAIQKAEGGVVPAPQDAPVPAVTQDPPAPAEAEDQPWYESVPQFVAARQLYDAAGEVLSGYRDLASGESPMDEFGAALSKSPTSVPAEMAASMVTGAAGQSLGGLYGIGKTAASGAEEGARAVEDVSGSLAYQPKAESTQRAMQSVAKAGEAWERLQELTGGAGAALAEAAGAEPGSTAAGVAYAAGATVPDAIGTLFPAARLRKGAAGAEPAPATVEELTRGVQAAGSDRILTGAGRAAEEAVAREVRPEIGTVKAFEDIGLPAESVPAEVLSGSGPFRELAGVARSVPGSESSIRYGQFLDNLKTKADELAKRADADDPSVLNLNVEEALTRGIERARTIEKDLYDSLDSAVRPDKKVDVSPITSKLLGRLDEVGGDLSELSGMEKRLFQRFLSRQKDAFGRTIYAPKEKTWSGLTGLRKELNAARGGKGGFGDAASYELDDYANTVSSTLRKAADEMGFGDQYAQAMQATGAKKAAQEAAQKVLGKNLDKSFTAMFDTRMNNLVKGRVKEFDDAVKALPEVQREQAIKSMVYQKVFKQQDMNSPVDIAGFNRWYNMLDSNEGAKRALFKHLDPQTRKDITSLGKAVGAVKRANEDTIATGRLLAAQEGFKLGESIIKKVAGGLPLVGGMMGGQTGGIAGAAAGSALQGARQAKRLNVATSDLLGSPSFQRHVANIVSDAKAGTLRKSEKALSESIGWKRYLSALPKAERDAAKRAGVTAWLNSANQE